MTQNLVEVSLLVLLFTIGICPNTCLCSIKKGVLRNFTKFAGKHLCQSLFFKKVAGLGHANFLKFLRTPFFTEHLWTTASAKLKNNLKNVLQIFSYMTLYWMCRIAYGNFIFFSKNINLEQEIMFGNVKFYWSGLKKWSVWYEFKRKLAF